MFELHPRLAQDTYTVGDYPLCRLLLMNDANYPWFILVPRRAEIREIFELDARDQIQFLKESSGLSMVLHKVFHADKINIAALGNMVPQLHIHHVVRYQNDKAWPHPVWGFCEATPYKERQRQELCAALTEHLQDFVPNEDCSAPPRVC